MLKMQSRLVRFVTGCCLAITTALGAPAEAQTPPAQPGVGQLGGAGPCTEGTGMAGFGPRSNLVWVIVPSGTGSPRSGGQCNDSNRPVIFFAPGYRLLPQTPERYRDLIDNMVSNGYVVVFANAGTGAANPGYDQVWTGFQYAATTLNGRIGNRMDLANVGIWGHSFGAGSIPWLARMFGEVGWGSNSLWLSANATSWVFSVEQSGDITGIPSHARMQVIAYNNDNIVDQGVAIDMYHAMVDIPYSQKDFIHLQADGSYQPDHTLPTTGGSAESYLDDYGVYRNYQALADCTRFGTNCSVDLTYMGTWGNGQAAKPAFVSDNPIDMVPGDNATLVQCGERSGSAQARCAAP